MEKSMSVSRRTISAGGLSLLAATSLSSTAKSDGVIDDIIEGTDEFALAVEAYTFGYPLVTMEMTRRVVTNVAAPVGLKSPMGQMGKARE
jgi:hypothetical protein